MSKTVFITGATSGIGLASAELFAKNHFNIIICGRRKERLNELKSKLGENANVHSLVFDVRDKDAVLLTRQINISKY
jgi:NADP-dependent 3-hydroxy acid dehydrogenase YdfG